MIFGTRRSINRRTFGNVLKTTNYNEDLIVSNPLFYFRYYTTARTFYGIKMTEMYSNWWFLNEKPDTSGGFRRENVRGVKLSCGAGHGPEIYERAWQWFRYMIVKLAPQYEKLPVFRTSLAKKSMIRCQAWRKSGWCGDFPPTTFIIITNQKCQLYRHISTFFGRGAINQLSILLYL